MAKQANELTTRKVLQNLRTKKTNDEIISLPLKDNVALGEIIVQMGTGATADEQAKKTGLWTLASDGVTPVRFPSEKHVEEMIQGGAVEEVDKIETAIGLSSDGTYIDKSGTAYLDDATSVEGEIGALDTALKGVQDQINAMDANTVADDNKVVSDVTQENGQITATAKNITAVKIGGYAEGSDAKVAETDTLGEALGKLQGQINGMDKAADAVNGQVVTTVSEADGKVSETKANVKDLQLGGYAKDTTKTGDIAATDTINDALSKLENKANAITISNADGSINVTTTTAGTDVNVNIKSGEKVIRKDGNGGLFTDIKISGATAQELADLGTNVREAYKLLDSNGEKLGDWIKIYKDSSLVNVELGHIGDLLTGTTAITEEADSSTIVPTSDTGASEALNFVYQLENGKYKLAQVNVESFLQESEFKDGLSVNSETHEVKVKIDDTSEQDSQSTPVSFLTVGPDGVKLRGIKDEITRKINALDYTDTAATGQYVTKVDEADGIISVDRANVSEAVLNNYAKGSDSTAVAATDTINQAVGKLENQIDKAKAAATTKVVEGTDEGNNMTIVPTTGADESVTYTVNLTDVASKTALDAEIAARKAVDGQTGQTYAANTGANYINDANSLNAADVKLDAILGKDESAGAGNSGNTVFDTTNTVAKNISDIKKDIDAFKHQLTLSIVDDNKYINTDIQTAATGTVIGVSAITKPISASTASDSALADSYDVRTFAVNNIVASDTRISVIENTATGNTEGVRKIDFSLLSIDCGEF